LTESTIQSISTNHQQPINTKMLITKPEKFNWNSE